MINNYYLFKNNMAYAMAKFLKANKILKESIGIFFSNLDLVLI